MGLEKRGVGGERVHLGGTLFSDLRDGDLGKISARSRRLLEEIRRIGPFLDTVRPSDVLRLHALEHAADKLVGMAQLPNEKGGCSMVRAPGECISQARPGGVSPARCERRP